MSTEPTGSVRASSRPTVRGEAPTTPPALSWTLRISSGVSEGVHKSVEQSGREFLNIGVGDRQ